EDSVGLVDAPAIHELRRLGGFGGVAFAGAAVGPGHQRVDLFLGERAVVAELAEVRIGGPWRHFAGDDGFADGLGPGTHLLVGQERHGSRFVRPVASPAGRFCKKSVERESRRRMPKQTHRYPTGTIEQPSAPPMCAVSLY